MNPQDLMPQTPLQQALQGEAAAAQLQSHSLRLQLCRRQLLQRLAEGLAPADYSRHQLLLAMCDAALRLLPTLAPDAAAMPARAQGPAVGLPRPALSPMS